MRLAVALGLVAAASAAVTGAALAESAEPGDGRVVKVLHNPPGDAPILGPRHAPVTIEFFLEIEDYTAERVYPMLVELARRHPLRLRVVYRPVINRRVDPYGVGTLAIEAFHQGRFHELLEHYYGNRSRSRSPSQAQLEVIAKEVGIDFERYSEAFKTRAHDSALLANVARANRYKLLGPKAALLINGRPYPRPTSLDRLETYYDTAYAEARELLERGVPLAHLYTEILQRRTRSETVPRVEVGPLDGRVVRRPKKNGVPLVGPVDYHGPHSRGATRAPVVIVSFCRFSTQNCSKQFEAIGTAMAAFEGQVRHVFKPIYDPEKDPHERRVHLAAECAAEQGAFWEFVALAYGGYHSRPRSADDDLLEQIFANLYLDDRQFERCLSSERLGAQIDRQLAEAVRVGVKHSPTTVIGGRAFIGRLEQSSLINLLEHELAPGILGDWLGGETASADDDR